jgi:hypothetical protein
MSTLKILRQLHTIIGDALSKIETDFDDKTLDWPSLDDAHAIGPAEVAASAPNSVDASNLIVAAAEQLTATIRGPAFTLFDASMGVSEAADHVPVMLITYFSIISQPACGLWNRHTLQKYSARQVLPVFTSTSSRKEATKMHSGLVSAICLTFLMDS